MGLKGESLFLIHEAILGDFLRIRNDPQVNDIKAANSVRRIFRLSFESKFQQKLMGPPTYWEWLSPQNLARCATVLGNTSAA